MANRVEQDLQGTLLKFPSQFTIERPPSEPIATVYTPVIVEFFSELGVPDQFLAMLGRYSTDTQVTITDQSDESFHEVCKRPSTSGEFVWGRRTNLSFKHINNLGLVIDALINHMDVRSNPDLTSAGVVELATGNPVKAKASPRTRAIRTIASNIAYLETTADALGNCLYMQHRFDHYIPDFNGSYYRGHDSVSRIFWDSYALKMDEKDHEKSIAQDHRDFRSGIALMFLNDELLRHELVNTMTEAQWVTRALAYNYPTPRRYIQEDMPMDETEIKRRCMGMYVRNGVLLEYAKPIH